MEESNVKNILFIGIGGQGIILASDIFTEAAFLAGFDVKKSEIHGMSQRGGSVSSDVRYGKKVYSPIIPEGRVNYLIALEKSEIERYQSHLAPNAVIIQSSEKIIEQLPNPKTINIALLGMLSVELEVDISLNIWIEVLSKKIKEKFLNDNKQAFMIGRGIKNGD